MILRKRGVLGFLILLVAVLALAAAGCGGDDDDDGGDGGGGGGAVEALPSASCGPIRKGEEEPDALIASDFPLQGANRSLTTEMADAIEYMLEQQDWKAGDTVLGYQSCDDSTAQAGSWDSAKCSSNGRAYANNASVIGVIGTFNSGCAKLVIPIANRESLAMVSPANTYPGLTEGGPGTEAGEPDNYYPSGTRNYARVVWNDQFQGAANAQYAKELGLKKIFILNDGETYGLGIATAVRGLRRASLGIQILGNQKWDKKASSYESLASRISSSGADGVFLGGIVCNNGGKLIKDIKAGAPNVQLLGPDGWTPISATIEGAGAAANNMYITQPGVPVDQLKGAGKEFVDGFTEAEGKAPNPYTAYAAQATQVLLAAIEKGGTDRAAVSSALFETDVTDGIIGSFQIDENGDTTLGLVSVYQVKNGEETYVKSVTPELDFVEG